MIPTIGVMIGFYICFRALDVLARPSGHGATFMKIMAVLLILATLFMMIDLTFSGSRAALRP